MAVGGRDVRVRLALLEMLPLQKLTPTMQEKEMALQWKGEEEKENI